MRTLEERFWPKVQKTEDCWLWIGARTSAGYGHLYLDGSQVLAHRAAFFLTHGEWPMQVVHHECEVKLCVNPAHLSDVSSRENTMHGPRGECERRGACGRGHDWTAPDAFYRYPNGRRECAACRRQRIKEGC